MALFGPPRIDKLKAKGDVKGLVNAIGHEVAQVRHGAAVALGQLGDPAAVEALISAIDDPIDHVRKGALWALGRLGDERAVEPAIAVVTNRSERDSVRQHAAEALGLLGDARAVEPLIAMLDRTNVGGRQSAAEALGMLGTAAVEPLVAALADEGSGRAEMAADVLVKLGWTPKTDLERARFSVKELERKRDVDGLIAALEDSATAVREAAAKSLGRLGDGRAVDPLITALAGWVWEVHRAAAEALGLLGDSRAIAPLTKMVSSGDPRTRVSAVVALGRLKDPMAIPGLTAALDDVDFRVFGYGDGLRGTAAYAAIQGLVEIGEEGIGPLVALLSSGGLIELRSEAALALGRIGGDRSVAALTQALHDPQGKREESWTGTGDYTINSITNRYPVREAAVTALKMIGTAEATRALENAPPTVETVSGGFAE